MYLIRGLPKRLWIQELLQTCMELESLATVVHVSIIPARRQNAVSVQSTHSDNWSPVQSFGAQGRLKRHNGHRVTEYDDNHVGRI